MLLWVQVVLGSGGAGLLLHDLRFGAEPVVQLVAVFAAPFFIEFIERIS
jgi:hypothetical protein